MIGLPAQAEKVLNKVLKGKLSKAEASRKLGVSRKTIYKWLQKYQLNRDSNKVTEKRKLNKRKDYKNRILRIVVANPHFGPKKIASELTKRGSKISNRSVWLALRDMNLQTSVKRENYAYNFIKSTQSRDPRFPGHLRLEAQARKRMVEEVLLSGRKVGEVIKKYGVSRKTYAKWKQRYQMATIDSKNILNALSDQNPLGPSHPRGVSESTEKAVLNKVVLKPELSSAKIAEKLNFIGNHGVQNILNRNNLNRYEFRLAYSKAQKLIPKPVFERVLNRIRLVWEQFIPSLAPAPPPALSGAVRFLRTFATASVFALTITYSLFTWIEYLSSRTPAAVLGLFFASVALFMGSIFFLYSLKYYITLAIVLSFSQKEDSRPGGNMARKGFISWILGLTGNGSKREQPYEKPIGLTPSLENIILKKHPYVSVHIPLYNERRVVKRILRAATNFEYPEYEVILADDSTDETSQIISDYLRKSNVNIQMSKVRGEGWTMTQAEIRPGVILKHVHRTTRSGYKGGALRLALRVTDPRAEFVSVFDADFVPYPDTLGLFLKYFQATAGSLDFRGQRLEARKEKLSSNIPSSNTSPIAAVQGYQWHVLNKSENWITRGVRSEYAGSYVIERSGEEIYGGLKQISGAVYMIRRDVLQEVGWETSITEDFQLTLKLYEKGYKVVYTPYIQAPAECVSTLTRLVRQRMRWAEGHSNNVKKMFSRVLFNKNLSTAEKLEFLYLSPYYLQAFFFIVGTLAWLISETLFPARLPFWTSLWGWSLVLTNLLALPLMNSVGLFLEESEERDYAGILSFIALSYILVPFQAYASIKGFLEREEGPWFRTPKTGHITDVFTRGRFYRFISGILPRLPSSIGEVAGGRGGRAQPAVAKAMQFRLEGSRFTNKYLALSTANNRFDSFNIRPKRKRWLGKVVLAVLLIISMNLAYFSQGVTLVQASPGTQVKTVEFFVSQYTDDSLTRIASGAGIDGGTYNSTPWPTFTIDLPESDIDIKRAVIQWNTVVAGKAADTTDIDWQFRKSGEGTWFDDDGTDAPDYIDGVDGGGKVEHMFAFFFDVTPRVTSGDNTYEFDAQLTGGARLQDAVKIFVTYEYDDTSSTQVKTVRNMVGCETSKTTTTDTTPTFVASDFDTYTVNPNLKEGSITIESHWIEYNAHAISDGSNKDDSKYRVDYTGDESEETGGVVWVNNGNTSKGNVQMLLYEELANSSINLTSNNTIKLGMSATTNFQQGTASAICAEWVITYSYDHGSMAGDDETHTRTVTYFMGVLSGCGTTDCRLPTSMTEIGTENIYIPEDGVDGNFKSVYLRYQFGFTSNKLNLTFTPKMTIDADGDAYTSTGTAFTYYSQKKNSAPAVALFDVTSFWNTNWDDGDDVKIEAQASVNTADSDFFDVPWAELIVTYDFNAETNTSDDIKTVYWWMDNSTQGRTADFTETTDSWNRTFDTFIPESGTKTWRSSAVIAKLNRGNTDGMTITNRVYTITVDDTAVGGTDTQAAAAVSDMKVSTFHWFALETDTQIPATFATQTDINFDITFDTYTTSVNTEIMPAVIAYTTYQYDGPEVPEKVLIAVGLAFIIPAIIRFWKRRRKGRLGVLFDLKGGLPPPVWLKARRPFNKGPGPP